MPRLIDLLVGIGVVMGSVGWQQQVGGTAIGKSPQNFFHCDGIFEPTVGLDGCCVAGGMLQSMNVGRWQWSARGIVGGSMCGNSHVCLSRFAAAFFAHGEPSTAESSANYDKQSGHVNIF